jgi:hypothetical protein
MGLMLDAMILTSLMHALAPSPSILVVSPGGAPVGTVAEVAQQPERLEAVDHPAGESAPYQGDDHGDEPGIGDRAREDEDFGGGDHDAALDDGAGMDFGDDDLI